MAPTPPSRDGPPLEGRPLARRFPIVGIGASAGGLEAFTDLLGALPPDTGMAFVLVQHLDPHHDSSLTQLLARGSKLPVEEVTHEQRVEPDHVYVIPPNKLMSLAGGMLQLAERSKQRAALRSIDHFFESLAHDQHEMAIGIVLSGTASDGTAGLEAIKAEGGITFAQDDSARFDSMPRSAEESGAVDLVLSPAEIARELARMARHPHLADSAAAPPAASPRRRGAGGRAGRREPKPAPAAPAGPDEPAPGAAQGRQAIVDLLAERTGVDFSVYKESTLGRRISRRMALGRHATPEAYARALRGDERELEKLFEDTLIGVTGFFRNPEAFGVLADTVFPTLLDREGNEPVRVWVAGCSTGQEAYSIAIAFAEVAERLHKSRRLQLFATDLNERSLERGRHGLYPKSIAQDLAPERLRRYFVEEPGGYRVVKSLRESIVFARQNVIADPPFSHLGLVCCRNLMIYLEPELQRRLFRHFHYALDPDGFLMLGLSESIAGAEALFEPIDRKQRIYRRKGAASAAARPRRRTGKPAPAPAPAPPQPKGSAKAAAPARPAPPRVELDALREADRITVERLAPPGVLVDADFRVVQFRGATAEFLAPPSGRASFDVLRMAREGLSMPLRLALREAAAQDRPVRRPAMRVGPAGERTPVELEIVPLRNLRERSYLVLFRPAAPAPPEADGGAPAPAAGQEPAGSSSRELELERELAEARDYLRAIEEQHEAASQELQASNEEVESANEELQSVNEELETSKEELESANEELVTVNDEMVSRNEELQRLNDDLANVLTSTHLSIVVLGRDQTIRRFSAQAEKQLGLRGSDLGRSIAEVRHGLEIPELDRLITEVLEGRLERELETRDRKGCWVSLRVRPYLSRSGEAEGALLVVVDIENVKQGELEATAARDFADRLFETVREPLLVLDDRMRVERANLSFFRTFGIGPAETIGQFYYDLDEGEWDVPGLRAMLQNVLPLQTSIEEFEVEHDFARLGRRSMLLNARRVHGVGVASDRILLAIEDVTERRKAALALVEADRRKDEFLAVLGHELRNPLAPMRNWLGILQRTIEEPAAEAAGSASAGGERTALLRRAVGVLTRQVSQLVRLVDDLLDVGRVKSGKLSLRTERTELAAIIGAAVETVTPLYEERAHQLEVVVPPVPVHLEADVARLVQVLSNLLVNAGKYSEPGSRIRLVAEVEPWRRDADRVAIHIRDQGIGIPADQLPYIFDLFRQVGTDGTGLGVGLSLVKSIVEMHGGTVSAQSDGPGRGSEFVVRLPVAAAPPATSLELPSSLAGL